MFGVFVGSFDEFAGLEDGAGADEGDQVWCVDCSPTVLGSWNDLKAIARPAAASPARG